MIPLIRKSFNSQFSKEQYDTFLNSLNAAFPGQLDFRVAETPVFIPKDFKKKILDACESIVDIIAEPGFSELTKAAIPPQLMVPGNEGQPDFIAFDFGICSNASGEMEPQLIEMQGFPSLFAYEVMLDDICRTHFNIPEQFDCYLGGHSRDSYLQLLKKIILAGHEPQHVILLEIFPRKQKTRIDFFCTEAYLGIKMVCLTELQQEGKKLFYNLNGKKTEVKRIYNRVIFDELKQQPPEVQEKGKLFFEELETDWCPHPNWFYKISKYTLPMLRHRYIPDTWYLNEIKQIPDDLENYVLKPLFSFAGQGVVIDVTANDIHKIDDPENWILQRKVKYTDIIETPDVPARAEIRIFYFWEKAAARPVPVNNLARLSKGKMIGVRYNKDKEWVGGSLCYFEK